MPVASGASLNNTRLLNPINTEFRKAIIIGVTEQMHNGNEVGTDELGRPKRSSKKAGMVPMDMMGKITVQDVVTGVEFDIGTGFTRAQREELWAQKDSLIGKIVKYKYQPAGVKEKPRFPRFLGFRDRIDL